LAANIVRYALFIVPGLAFSVLGSSGYVTDAIADRLYWFMAGGSTLRSPKMRALCDDLADDIGEKLPAEDDTNVGGRAGYVRLANILSDRRADVFALLSDRHAVLALRELVLDENECALNLFAMLDAGVRRVIMESDGSNLEIGLNLDQAQLQRMHTMSTVLSYDVGAMPARKAFRLISLLWRAGASVCDVVFSAYVLLAGRGSPAAARLAIDGIIRSTLVANPLCPLESIVPHRVVDGDGNELILWSYDDVDYEVCKSANGTEYVQRSLSKFERERFCELVKGIDQTAIITGDGVLMHSWTAAIGEGDFCAKFGGGLLIPWNKFRVMPAVNQIGDVAVDSVRICVNVEENRGSVQWCRIGKDGTLIPTSERLPENRIFFGDSEGTCPVFHFQVPI
jgi:hypothetical protein